MFLHIGAGLSALAVGPWAMLARPKGSAGHRRAGRAYLWTMGGVGTTAALLLVFRWNPFFFALTVLSFYLALSGWRVLRRKRPHADIKQRASVLDFVAAVLTIAVGAASFGLWRQGVFGPDAAIVLGTLGFAVIAAVYDLWRFRRPDLLANRPALWLVEHITKICGSYIALACAFSGTVFTALPVAVAQTWPALVGVPLMLFVANGYWRRANKRPDARRAGQTPLAVETKS